MRQTILIVDDNEVVRKYIAVILAPKGYNLVLADCAESAMKWASKTSQLDLLIADLSLPDLCGTLLYEEVSASHPETRPLFISGYTEAEASQIYASDGFKGEFLAKPFLAKELVSRVEGLLIRPIE